MGSYYTIEELKKLAGDIPDPTCTLIDKIITLKRYAEKECKELEKVAKGADPENAASDLEICVDLSDSIRRDLDDMEGYLEDLRVANEQLRYLGEFWYSESKHYFECLKEIEKIVEEYQSTLIYKLKNFLNKKVFSNFKIKPIVKM